MSDPRPQKFDDEVRTVRSVLVASSTDHVQLLRGNDPPDVIVQRAAAPEIHVEVRHYKSPGDPSGAHRRWDQLRRSIYDALCLNQTAWSDPDPTVLGDIFREKDLKIRNAIQSGRYIRGNAELWLVISCGHGDDLASEIFHSPYLEDAVSASDYDLSGSVFHAVWLVNNREDDRAIRLFPAQST